MSNAIVDLIILSKATTQEKFEMTQRAIDTAISGNESLINIIVLEQGDYEYSNAYTHKMYEEFGYNKYANIGASMGKSDYIMIANNDLIFIEDWLNELLLVNYEVMSPWEPNDVRQADAEHCEKGFDGMRTFSGWCFMIKRSVWEKIGHFDETFKFWHSDTVVIHQLKQIGIAPMIVKTSIVEHLGSQTLQTETEEKQDEYTWQDNDLYIKKFNHDPFDGVREL